MQSDEEELDNFVSPRNFVSITVIVNFGNNVLSGGKKLMSVSHILFVIMSLRMKFQGDQIKRATKVVCRSTSAYLAYSNFLI